MMVLNATEAKNITEVVLESKQFKEHMKNLSLADQQVMHNIFSTIKKAAEQGENSVMIQPQVLNKMMTNFLSFLGYKLTKNELSW